MVQYEYIIKVATKYFKRRPLPTQSIESMHQDGTMEFIVTITDEMEIMPIVKYRLPHVRVLSPTWIGELIDEDLESYLEGGVILGNEANFVGVIKLNNPLKYEHKFKNGNLIFPYISFIAKIEKLN